MTSKLNILKVKYFKRITNLDDTRWTKIIYKERNTISENVEQQATKLAWDWPRSVNDILNTLKIKKNDIKSLSDFKIKQTIFKYDETKWKENMTKKSSLIHYRQFKTSLEVETYLKSVDDYKGPQLKFKARTNTLGLMYEKRKWENSEQNCACPCCGQEDETLNHFLFSCVSHSVHRQTLMNRIQDLLLSHKETNLNEEIKQGKGLINIFLGGSLKNYNTELYQMIERFFQQYLLSATTQREKYFLN